MKINYLIAAMLMLFMHQVNAQVYGCTDPHSTNYNPTATINNGSCTYPPVTVDPESSVDLPDTVDETSGLVFWGGNLYTHNDNDDTNLYRINASSGAISQTINVTGTSNQDWEDVDADDTYIYIGDTGNNLNGNRTNLRIIRVDKAGLQAGDPTVNSINFTYSNQTNFTGTGNNNTDFDCEAFIVGSDAIYLFTKQWVSGQTSVYTLPKTPGTHVAQLADTFNVDGLITGATYLEDKKLVILSGYSTTLQPFIYLLYDFTGHDFFGANKRKMSLGLAFNQIEGIATTNGTDVYVTNEHFQQSIITTNQKLHHLDLSDYIQDYLDDVASVNAATMAGAGIYIFPNPVADTLQIKGRENIKGRNYTITDMLGKQVQSGMLSTVNNTLDVETLAPGIYIVNISGYEDDGYKLVKR